MFFKRKKSHPKIQLLKDEDITQLRDIERQAYIEEAKILAVEKGKIDAKRDYNKKQEQSLW